MLRKKVLQEKEKINQVRQQNAINYAKKGKIEYTWFPPANSGT